MSAACTLSLLFFIALFWDTKAQTEQQWRKICPQVRSGQGVYGYKRGKNNGPTNWGNLAVGQNVCGTGRTQSPVNIDLHVPTIDISTRTRRGRYLTPVLNHRASFMKYADTPHNFDLACDNAPPSKTCGTLRFKSDIYEMAGLHFHSPSENRLKGKAYPMEVHFVHKEKLPPGSRRRPRLLVYAIFFKHGKFNRELQNMLDAACDGRKRVNLRKFVAQSKSPSVALAIFQGSLTTPPCAEGVQWLVSLNEASGSLAQFQKFRGMVAGGYTNRPIMPRNNRDMLWLH